MPSMPRSSLPISEAGAWKPTIADLARGEVHLWQCRCDAIDEPMLLQCYRALLSPEEAQQQLRFRAARDQHRYLLARALLRTSLSCYGARPPDHWRFQKGSHGKPEITNGSDLLRFNLSHSGDRVVCAIALQHDIGVDVEWLSRSNDVLAIAKRYFSEREVERLFTLPEARQRDRFFDYWTLKEAYIKARGEGISLGLGNFSFSLQGDDIAIECAPELADDPANWQFRLWRDDPDYRIALALRNSATPLIVRRIETVPLQSSTPQ